MTEPKDKKHLCICAMVKNTQKVSLWLETSQSRGTVLTLCCVSPPSCEMQYNDTGDTSDFCSDASRRWADETTPFYSFISVVNDIFHYMFNVMWC